MQKAIPFLLLLTPVSLSNAAEPYLKIESYNYSEPTSINSFLNDFNGHFEGGTQAFAHEWLETGVRMGNWELGILTRYDYDLSFSEEMAELYYLATNKLPLDSGRSFQLDLTAKHYKTDGLRLGRIFRPTDSLRISLGLAYLRGLRLTDGHLTGEATAVSSNDYDFTFQADYYYSEDPLFDRQVKSPNGWGYSVDLSTEWHPTPALGLHLQVNDLLGQIFWKRAPHTQARADSNNKTFDEDGYVEFLPTLSGLEGYHDFRQGLNPFGAISADYQLAGVYKLIYNGAFTSETFFSGIGGGYQINNALQAVLLFYPETRAMEFDFTGRNWRFRLASDAFTLNQANLLRVSANINWHF